MNWDQIEGKWHEITGSVKSQWGKLTDDDITNISGKRDVLVGKLQHRYGVMKDEAEKQTDEWIAKLSHKTTASKDGVS